MTKGNDDVKMTKDGATKFAHPSQVETLTALGWKAAKAAKTAKSEAE